jgi:hypothetical protein
MTIFASRFSQQTDIFSELSGVGFFRIEFSGEALKCKVCDFPNIKQFNIFGGMEFRAGGF